MEGRDEEMEANVTAQQDDDSIWTESDRVMEDTSKQDFE